MKTYKVRDNVTGQITEVPEDQLGSYGVTAPTATPTPQAAQSVQQPAVQSQPEQQVRQSLAGQVGNGALSLLGSTINPVIDFYNKAVSTTKNNAKSKGDVGKAVVSGGKNTADTFISPEAARAAADSASFAVPFGKAGFVGSKYIVPGAVAGGLAGASQKNATLPEIVGSAALGGALPGAGQAVGKALPKITSVAAQRIMNSVYKEPLKDTRAAIKGGKTLGQEALDRGGSVGSNEGIYNKAVQQINDTEGVLQDQLMGSKERVSFSKVLKDLTPSLDKLKQSGNPTYQTIQNRIEELKKTNGATIPVAQANQIKRSLYDEVRPSYGQQAPAGAEGIKAIAKSLKDQIAKAHPNVDQLNKDLSFYGRQADTMIDKAARGGRNDILGLGNMATLGAGLAGAGATGGLSLALPAIKMSLGSTLGKTASAKVLNTISKSPSLKGVPAKIAAQSASRLPLIVSQQTPSSENNSQENKQNHNILPPIQTGDSTSYNSTSGAQSQAQSVTGYTPEELGQAWTKAVAANDTKSATQLKQMYDMEVAYQKNNTGSTKPLNSASAQMLGKANAASAALDRVDSALSEDPNKLLALAVPGAPGVRQLEADYSSLADAIGGLRTGASVSPIQQKYYLNLLPKVGDSPETIKSKLAAVKAELQFYVQNGPNVDDSYGSKQLPPIQ